MAKRQIDVLTDDLDGSDADGTLTFAVDGASYELELSKKNRAAFDKAVAPYIAAARKARTSSAASTRRGSSSSAGSPKRTDLAEIRAWAREQGWEVSDRGRIAAEIIEAWDSAE